MQKSTISNIIFPIVTSAAIVATGVFAAKESKVESGIEETDTKFVKFKKSVKKYKFTLLSGSIGLLSSLSSSIINVKAIGAVSASALAIQQGYTKYRQTVKKVIDSDTYKKLANEIVSETTKGKIDKNDTRKAYYNDFMGVVLADEAQLALAIKRANDKLNDNTLPEDERYVYLMDILKEANVEFLESKMCEPYNNFGWSSEYLGNIYSKNFIHVIECSDGVELTDGNNKIVANLLEFEEDPIYLEV